MLRQIFIQTVVLISVVHLLSILQVVVLEIQLEAIMLEFSKDQYHKEMQF